MQHQLFLEQLPAARLQPHLQSAIRRRAAIPTTTTGKT